MKTILAKITVVLLALAAFTGCTSDATEPAEVIVPSTTVNITKRGLDYNGGEVIIAVRSNTYWVINYDTELVDWFTITPRAAFGDKDVLLTVKPNEGEQRRAALHFETSEGKQLDIDIFQSGVNEELSIYNEDFGTSEAETAIRYRGYAKRGIGSAFVEYLGNALISGDATSAGYEGASGGNCAMFDATHKELVLGPLKTDDDSNFRFSFGLCNNADTASAEGMKVEASLDGLAWYTVKYDIAAPAEAGKWCLATATFHTVDVTEMYLRFKGAENYLLDDIMLIENLGEDKGYELEFSLEGDDNHKVGFVYFSDYFNWVTADFGGSDYIANPQLNTAETRFDNVYLLSQQYIDIFEAAGWTQPDTATPVYLRLGYLKIGKSRTAGCVESPALTSIREGRTIHVKLSFQAAMMASADGATKDLDNICIEVVGGGTINSAEKTEIEVPIGVYNAWSENPYSVNIYNATHDTKIRFKTAYSTAALAALGKSNRFFIDEVEVSKISKGTTIEENWSEQLAAPTITAENIGCAKTSFSVQFTAVEHAFRYEYRVVRNDDRSEVASGIVDAPAFNVGGLQTDNEYAVTVRALAHEESLRYTPSEWCDEVIATPVDLDKHPSGYLFFEDDLAWLTDATFREGWYVDGGGDASTSFRSDAIGTTLSSDAKKIWDNHGYTFMSSSSYKYIYIHGNQYFRFGRAYNSGACLAGINLPVDAVGDITEGAAIDVVVGLNIKYYNNGDYGVVLVKAKTGDNEQVQRIALDTSTNEYQQYEVVFENVSSSTTFSVYNTNEGGKADRFWVNNFKITKQ